MKTKRNLRRMNQRPRMTRKLAEARAVGKPGGRKFDGTAFLRSLKAKDR